MRKSVKNNLICLFCGFLVAVVIYITAYFTCNNEYVLPSPLKILEKFFQTLLSLSFYKALFSTLLRVFIAFIISFILGAIFGVLAYRYKWFSGVFGVIIGLLRSLPVLAVLLIILLFTNRSFAPVVVCFLSLFPIIYTAVYTSLKGVPNDLKIMCTVYKIPVKKQVFSMYIPQILPKILLDAGGAFSFGIKLIVSAEILANVYGSVGGILQEASIYTLTSDLFAITFIVCILGVLVEFIAKLLSEKAEKRLV
jgi:NitT/TauT family transport system permease protein